jgi:hypothetical protein
LKEIFGSHSPSPLVAVFGPSGRGARGSLGKPSCQVLVNEVEKMVDYHGGRRTGSVGAPARLRRRRHGHGSTPGSGIETHCDTSMPTKKK